MSWSASGPTATFFSAGELTIKLAKDWLLLRASSGPSIWRTRRGALILTNAFFPGRNHPQSEVNDQIKRMGIVTIAGKPGDEEINQLGPDDIVIIPAFGTRWRPAGSWKRRVVILSTPPAET